MQVNTLISIGNSDDKLSQQRWSAFVATVRAIIHEGAEHGEWEIHGEWFSLPDQPWQNANWCIQIEAATEVLTPEWQRCEEIRAELRRRLQVQARLYDQDSIAWTEGRVEFLAGRDG